jgi:hypothetical protein
VILALEAKSKLGIMVVLLLLLIMT